METPEKKTSKAERKSRLRRSLVAALQEKKEIQEQEEAAQRHKGLLGKKFIVLGHELSAEHYPVLYRWHLTNPQTLEEQVRSLADKVHDGSVVAALQAFESDLEHG